MRIEILKTLARNHGKPVVYVNQVGGNDTLVFDGSSLAVMPDGRIAAQAKSFEEDMVLFDSVTGEGEIRPQPREEIEAAHDALVCGTRDYVRKCGFQKVTVGLSGGIDSAVVAAIATEALGASNVIGVAMPGPYSSPEVSPTHASSRQISESNTWSFRFQKLRNLFAVAETSI